MILSIFLGGEMMMPSRKNVIFFFSRFSSPLLVYYLYRFAGMLLLDWIGLQYKQTK
jgi:hypothetical protein